MNTGVFFKILWYQASFEFQISTTSSSFSSLRCSSQVAQPVLGSQPLPFPVLGFPTLTLHPHSAHAKAGLCLLCAEGIMSP